MIQRITHRNLEQVKLTMSQKEDMIIVIVDLKQPR